MSQLPPVTESYRIALSAAMSVIHYWNAQDNKRSTAIFRNVLVKITTYGWTQEMTAEAMQQCANALGATNSKPMDESAEAQLRLRTDAHELMKTFGSYGTQCSNPACAIPLIARLRRLCACCKFTGVPVMYCCCKCKVADRKRHLVTGDGCATKTTERFEHAKASERFRALLASEEKRTGKPMGAVVAPGQPLTFSTAEMKKIVNAVGTKSAYGRFLQQTLNSATRQLTRCDPAQQPIPTHQERSLTSEMAAKLNVDPSRLQVVRAHRDYPSRGTYHREDTPAEVIERERIRVERDAKIEAEEARIQAKQEKKLL